MNMNWMNNEMVLKRSSMAVTFVFLMFHYLTLDTIVKFDLVYLEVILKLFKIISIFSLIAGFIAIFLSEKYGVWFLLCWNLFSLILESIQIFGGMEASGRIALGVGILITALDCFVVWKYLSVYVEHFRDIGSDAVEPIEPLPLYQRKNPLDPPEYGECTDHIELDVLEVPTEEIEISYANDQIHTTASNPTNIAI
jgi:hypothetical protein